MEALPPDQARPLWQAAQAAIYCHAANVRFRGVKRTCRFALQMSASDPKRTISWDRSKAVPAFRGSQARKVKSAAENWVTPRTVTLLLASKWMTLSGTVSPFVSTVTMVNCVQSVIP